MRKYTFFDQYPTPIDTTEIGGFDILGIPEVRYFQQGGGRFEVSNSLTMTDILNEPEYKKEIPRQYSWHYKLIVADVKSRKAKESVEELRLLICAEFSKQLKTITDHRSHFYIPKERIVQYVGLPVSWRDLAPGDTSIHFRVFTERFLGEVEDA